MATTYILDGHTPVPCDDTHVWGTWMEHANRSVNYTLFKCGSCISTVFLGVDHQFGLGPPVLFETMVFGGPLDQNQVRAVCWDDAEARHKEMVDEAIDLGYELVVYTVKQELLTRDLDAKRSIWYGKES